MRLFYGVHCPKGYLGVEQHTSSYFSFLLETSLVTKGLKNTNEVEVKGVKSMNLMIQFLWEKKTKQNWSIVDMLYSTKQIYLLDPFTDLLM